MRLNTGDHSVPDSTLFDSAKVWAVGGDRFNVVVQYEIVPFGYRIVYVTFDNPEVLSGLCSWGGSVVEQLEPNWYLCQEDL